MNAVLLLDCVFALLVDRLGDARYCRREMAHRCLAAAGPLARPVLERADNHPTPEVRERVRRLLARWEEERLWEQADRIRPTSWPRTPWLLLPDHGAYGGYLQLARRKGAGTGYGAPDWPEYRLATRLWVRSQLWQRRPTAEIVEELDRMAEHESRWLAQHGSRYKAVAASPTGR